jgi:hypothetical protein
MASAVLALTASSAGMVVESNPGLFTKPIDTFCRGTNGLFRQTVLPAVRERFDIRDTSDAVAAKSYLEKARATGSLTAAASDAKRVFAGDAPRVLSPPPPLMPSGCSQALSPPEYPGLSRPTSLVILASVPTALVWCKSAWQQPSNATTAPDSMRAV